MSRSTAKLRPFTIGEKVGLLTIIDRAPPQSRGKPGVVVQCVCGKVRTIAEYELHKADVATCMGKACRIRWRGQLKREQARGVWRLSAKCSAPLEVGGTFLRARSLVLSKLAYPIKPGTGGLLVQRSDELNLPATLYYVPLPKATSESKWLWPFSEDYLKSYLSEVLVQGRETQA